MTVHKVSRLTLFSLIVLTVAAAGALIAQEPPQEKPVAPATEFEGTATLGVGNYFYLPAARGYDIYVQGKIQSQDTSSLNGKEVRVKGSMYKDDPSIFVADSIEVKDAAGAYQSVFTRTEEVKLENHLRMQDRGTFPVLALTKAENSQDWEGKGKAKIKGQLVGDAIVVSDDKGKEVGKILVDSTTDFAKYYIQKLKLFNNKLFFYLNIKDTIDLKVRRRTRELFHADILFAGLY